MNASDSSLYLDENLARLLAAYDQEIGEADGKAATVGIPPYVPSARSDSSGIEPSKVGSSAHPLNEGSAGELLPDLSVPHTPTPGYRGVAGPHRIGRFELRRQLGKGGCGIVFLAYDPKLKREVALKLPRPEMLLSPDARRRLIREAHAAAEFDHPNLVPVYETGEIGPLCFIATAFCPGQTLAEWLDRQAFPVPIRQAARLVAQIADAIQHAHDRGVLHRDMKPNNVILQETKADPNDVGPPPGSCMLRGDHFIPRVVDFGLAKIPERGPSETASRQILGTPKYMAPEQAQARHDDIGPQADVYALGVILYELLAGRAPYEGANDMEVLRQAIEGNLTPPRNLRQDVPRDLEAICLKAMARTPAKRYRTAIDLADDLRRFLDGLPTLARPLNRIGRAARWLRRNDQIVALAVVTAIAIFFLTIGLWTAYQSELLRTDRDNIRAAQDGRARLDRQYEYARQVRNAFFAWRAGDSKQMGESLDAARSAAAMNAESPDFAWGYLSQLAKFERVVIASPFGPALSLAVSPGGDRIATGHQDGTVALWDSRTGTLIAIVKAEAGGVTQLVFVDGGSRLATAGAEPAIHTWVITAGTRLEAGASISDLGSAVCSLAPAEDGRHLSFCTVAGHFGRWSPADGRLVEKRENATEGEPVQASAVSRDGRMLVVAHQDGIIRLRDRTRPEAKIEFRLSGRVRALNWIPGNGSAQLAAIDEEGRARLFDRQGRQTNLLQNGGNAVLAMTASPDGTLLALGGNDGSVTIWDLTRGSIKAQLRGHEAAVRQVRFGADGRWLYSASDDGMIRSWNLATDPDVQAIRSFSQPLTAIAVARDGQAYAVAFADGSVESYTNWGGTPRRLKGAGAGQIRLLVAGDGHDPVGVELTGTSAVVWSLAEPPRLVDRVATDSRSRITAADLSRDGEVLVIGDESGRVAVWSIPERRVLGTFATGLRAPVKHLVVSDDGRWIASQSSGNTVGVWEAGKSERMFSIAAGGAELWLVRFLPGGERLVTAGEGSSIKVWSLAGIEELSLLGHVGRITAMAVSPDGRTLMSGTSAGQVRLWDLRTGEELMGVRRHDGPVQFAEFAGAGTALLTGTSSTTRPSDLALWEIAKE